MKTTKQIADELGVTKQQVYRYIKRHNIKEAHQENGVLMYNETSETLIKQWFLKTRFQSPETHQSASNSEVNETLIKMLQSELQTKNKQIEALTEQVSQLTTALTATTESLQASQALHAGTMQQQLEAPAPKKKGFFNIFKKVESNE